MLNKFIAELHDIGKIVDKDALENIFYKGHTFENINFDTLGVIKPSSPSWWGQYHHKINYEEDIYKWDEIDTQYRVDLFLLIIADHLASSLSRVLPQLGFAGESEGVVKLWNINFYEKEKYKGKFWAAFRTNDDFKKLFEIIDTINSSEEFLEQYKDFLLLTPEDKAIPRNITSLYTHVELVGKIYRALKKHCHIEKNNDGLYLILNRNKVTKIKEAEGGHRTTGAQNVEKGKWQARFVKCWIKFPHSLVRLQDINLLVKRQQLLSNFINNYKDYIMLSTQDFLSLFLPEETNLMDIFKEFLNNGFFIEYIETKADLGILTSNLDLKILKAKETNEQSKLVVFNNRNTKVYRKVLITDSIPPEISPHICDICQMNLAKERIKENIREWICDKCYEIRELGESFNYPEEWLNSKIMWFKFNLNQNKLEKWLQKAFSKYLDNLTNLNDKETLKEEFRSLACQADFVKDYLQMVKEFWDKCSSLEINKPISDYNELGLCKYSGIIVKNLLENFLEIYDTYFPHCDSDDNSPISLSLSISLIKSPVREHWRYFENQKGFLNLRNQFIFEDTYSKEEAKKLLERLPELKKVSSHFLYNLITINEKLNSEIYTMAEIFNNRNKYPLIYELFRCGIKPRKILNFFRLIGEVDETF